MIPLPFLISIRYLHDEQEIINLLLTLEIITTQQYHDGCVPNVCLSEKHTGGKIWLDKSSPEGTGPG